MLATGCQHWIVGRTRQCDLRYIANEADVVVKASETSDNASDRINETAGKKAREKALSVGRDMAKLVVQAMVDASKMKRQLKSIGITPRQGSFADWPCRHKDKHGSQSCK